LKKKCIFAATFLNKKIMKKYMSYLFYRVSQKIFTKCSERHYVQRGKQKNQIMKSTVRILSLFIFMFSSVYVYSQDSISSNKLCKDVKYAFSFIRKTHINPYAYTDKKTVDSTEQIILGKLKERTKWSLLDFSIMMSLKTNSLFDGHTSIGNNLLYNIENIKYDSALYFPWEVSIKENLLYVIYDEQELKIQSINKQNANDVLKQIQHSFYADVELSAKNKLISLYFPYYYILIPPESNILFEIEVVNAKGEIMNITENGKTKEEIQTDIATKRVISPRDKKEYQLDFYPNDIALLTVNRFHYDSEEDYFVFLAESFKAITEHQSKYLFIDISNNGGGSDYNVFSLIDYLFEDEYKIFGEVFENRISKARIKQIGRWNYIKYGLKQKRNTYTKRLNNTIYGMTYCFYERQKDILHPFTGQIFLLQGYRTGSASLTMSSAIKASRRGIVIGETTGQPASLYANNIKDKLPYSKLQLYCSSSFSILPTGSYHDKWIEPDIYLDLDKTELNEQTLNDLVEQCQREYPHFFKYKPNAVE
jgi:hypothetical protein